MVCGAGIGLWLSVSGGAGALARAMGEQRGSADSAISAGQPATLTVATASLLHAVHYALQNCLFDPCASQSCSYVTSLRPVTLLQAGVCGR